MHVTWPRKIRSYEFEQKKSFSKNQQLDECKTETYSSQKRVICIDLSAFFDLLSESDTIIPGNYIFHIEDYICVWIGESKNESLNKASNNKISTAITLKLFFGSAFVIGIGKVQ